MQELIDQYLITFLVLTVLFSIGFVVLGIIPSLRNKKTADNEAPATLANETSEQPTAQLSDNSSWENLKLHTLGILVALGTAMMFSFIVLALFHAIFRDTGPACGKYEDLNMCIESSPSFSE